MKEWDVALTDIDGDEHCFTVEADDEDGARQAAYDWANKREIAIEDASILECESTGDQDR